MENESIDAQLQQPPKGFDSTMMLKEKMRSNIRNKTQPTMMDASIIINFNLEPYYAYGFK